jgi:general secretion pathway protein G
MVMRVVMHRRSEWGLTLIELLIVMALLAILATMAAPRYLERAEAARETLLKHNLHGLRTSLDLYYRDKGKYPAQLQQLADERYIREIPLDPITNRTDTWVIVPPKSGSTDQVFDVKSGAPGAAKDGSVYANW